MTAAVDPSAHAAHATLWSAAQHIMGADDRPEQTELFLRMLDTLDLPGRRTVAVQGPTGVGKSLAAVPLLLGTGGGRVVYACATKSQQRQVHATIGAGLTAAGLGPSAVLFGRNEYYCERRASENRDLVANALKRLRWNPPEIRGNGMRADYPELESVWYLVNSDADDGCAARVCRGDDAHSLAARAATAARLLVVNHHLLTLAGGLAVPPYDPAGGLPIGATEAIVVDEAHELPGVLESVHGAAVTVTRLRRAARAVQRADGDVPGAWEDRTADWAEATEPSGYGAQPFTGNLLAATLADDARWMLGRLDEDDEDPKVGAAVRTLNRLTDELDLLATTDTEHARWIEKTNPKARHGKAIAVPLDVAPYAGALFARHRRTVVMSATLDGHPADRLGLGGTVLVGASPFDLAGHRLGYVSNRSLDADGWRHVQADWPDETAVDELAQLIDATPGGVLVLATSHASKHRAYERLSARGIVAAEQGRTTASVPGLVAALAAGRIKALVGVDSLATGIDIPGDALSTVVWLAWPNPETRHPLGEAITARYGDSRTAWDRYWSPAARLKAEQGVGRLIRTPDDRGVVALLDPRRRFKRTFSSLVMPSRTIPSVGAVRHHFAAAEAAV